MATLFARLQADVPLKLRRGAWYRVIDLTDLKASIEVNRRRVDVFRAWLEIRERPPLRWSLVTKGVGDRKVPPHLRGTYGVCPSCRARAPLPKRAATHTCARCRQEFDVNWSEATPPAT